MPSEDDVSRDAADDFKQVHDVIIVGAGAAGIGVAISVAHSGVENFLIVDREGCLLYTSPSPRDKRQSRMPSSA